MINHHPSPAVLNEFALGTLPASVSIIVSSHIEMCPVCQAQLQQLTEAAATDAFEQEDAFDAFTDTHEANASVELLNAIMSHPIETDIPMPKTITEIDIAGSRIALPRAMKSIALKEWQGVGKISRARLDLADDAMRTSLLHIPKGGSVPQHSHKGFEITLLLDGSFEDELGRYQKGDFIWLDNTHTHSPTTLEGCVCLTVSSDALRFTQGVSQLLNPLGKLIY
jgi:putative transcriptional regulator